MKHNYLIILASLVSIVVLSGSLYAFALGSNASSNQGVTSSVNAPINATASTAQTNLGNQTISITKEDGIELRIMVQVNNPLKFSGTMINPTGEVYQMNSKMLEKGMMQLSANITDSEPSGSYVIQTHITKTSNTSDFAINLMQINHKVPKIFVGATLPPKSITPQIIIAK
jgi:hypothetical protein